MEQAVGSVGQLLTHIAGSPEHPQIARREIRQHLEVLQSVLKALLSRSIAMDQVEVEEQLIPLSSDRSQLPGKGVLEHLVAETAIVKYGNHLFVDDLFVLIVNRIRLIEGMAGVLREMNIKMHPQWPLPEDWLLDHRAGRR